MSHSEGADAARLVLHDLFARVPELVHPLVADLGADEARARPGGNNPIAWLVWHLVRQQDVQLADAAGFEQVWTRDGYAARTGLRLDPDDLGYGHDAETVDQVAAAYPVPMGPDVLVAYVDAVAAQTAAFVATVGPDDLARVVDDAWDPPVTLAARLVSIAGDALQHAGQAAYLRGMRPPAGTA